MVHGYFLLHLIPMESLLQAGKHAAQELVTILSSSDKKVKIWDIGTRQNVHTFSQHDDQVRYA